MPVYSSALESEVQVDKLMFWYNRAYVHAGTTVHMDIHEQRVHGCTTTTLHMDELLHPHTGMCNYRSTHGYTATEG